MQDHHHTSCWPKVKRILRPIWETKFQAWMQWSVHKACGWYFVTFLIGHLYFGWCVVRWVSKNKHHKNTCFKEIGLRLKNIVKHSILNIGTQMGRPTYQLRNWQTSTIKTHNWIGGGVRFSIWSMMLHHELAIATQVSFCKHNEYNLEEKITTQKTNKKKQEEQTE